MRQFTGAGAHGDLNRARTIIPQFVPLRAPLTSTDWDGDSYGTVAKTKIDLSAVFSVPASARAVLVHVEVNDSGSAAADKYIILSPNNTAGQGLAVSCGEVNDRIGRGCLTVPCDASGDIYYQTVASGAGNMDITLEIWGYYL